MKNENSISKILPLLFGFFIMGFCDVVGITSTHVKADFGLSDTMSNMIPVALFSMFLLFSVPTGVLMNKIGRKRENTLKGDKKTYIPPKMVTQ